MFFHAVRLTYGMSDVSEDQSIKSGRVLQPQINSKQEKVLFLLTFHQIFFRWSIKKNKCTECFGGKT